MQFTQENFIHKRYKRARTNASSALIESRIDKILNANPMLPVDAAPVPIELSDKSFAYLEENGLDTNEWAPLDDNDIFEDIDFSCEDDMDQSVSDQDEEEIFGDKGIKKTRVLVVYVLNVF